MRTPIMLGIALVVTGASIAAIVTTLSVIPQAQQSPPEDSSLGYTDGRHCFLANGCGTYVKFSQCLDCCMTRCPYPWNDGCIDECIAQYDPKGVYSAATSATRVISERQHDGQGEARSVLVALQRASNKRISHVARLLAVEAQDYGGTSGILQGDFK